MFNLCQSSDKFSHNQDWLDHGVCIYFDSEGGWDGGWNIEVTGIWTWKSHDKDLFKASAMGLSFTVCNCAKCAALAWFSNLWSIFVMCRRFTLVAQETYEVTS